MDGMNNGQADETMLQDEGDLHATARDDEGDAVGFVLGELPNVKNSRLEDVAHRLVLRLRARLEAPDPARATLQTSDNDLIDICNEVEDAIQLAQSAVLPVPKLLEVTGNVEERELAARYMDQKQAACLGYAKKNARLAEQFEHAAEMFRVCAGDFRAGLHLPDVHVSGRVIPYNDTNDTGIRHEDSLRRFFEDTHARNVKAGWWSEIETGDPKKRNVGELLILFVTEMAEAYDAWCINAADDKLPQHPGIGVELADLGIRWADFCGALLAGRILMPMPQTLNPGDEMFREILAIARRYESIRKTPEAVGDPETADFLPPMDVAQMIDEKLAFNANRPDHKIENRLKADGKRT